MPNWCQNFLRVQGKKEEVEEFVRFVRSEKVDEEKRVFDFNKILPEDDAESCGYEWLYDYWGTKWNSYDSNMLISPGIVNYNFLTAWSPPLPVIHEAGLRFPHLEFTIKYIEYGMGFKGTFRIRNGKIIEDVYGKIPDEEYENADNVFY
jgi:hypothetical protein